MKDIWNNDIRNQVVSGLWIALLLFIISLLPPFFKSVFKKISFEKAFQSVYSWHGISFPKSIVLLIFIFFLTVTTVITIYNIFRDKNPIEWNLDGFLGMGGRGNNGLIKWKVKFFEITGKNRSSKPITNLYGYIEIERTRERIPLMISNNGPIVSLDKFVSLPPEETITLVSSFEKDVVDFAALAVTTFRPS